MTAIAVKAPSWLPSQSDDADAKPADELVRNAEIAIEDQAADQSDDGVGGGQRNDQRHPGQGAQHAQTRTVQHQRDDDAKHDLHRHHRQEELAGPQQASQKVWLVSVERSCRSRRRGSRPACRRVG